MRRILRSSRRTLNSLHGAPRPDFTPRASVGCQQQLIPANHPRIRSFRCSASQLTATTHGSGLIPPPPSHPTGEATPISTLSRNLPTVCSGCGALSQTVDSGLPGYFDPKKKGVVRNAKSLAEDKVFEDAMARLLKEEGGADHEFVPRADPVQTASPVAPICDRCHDLMYQNKGASIIHPSMQSIQSIIESSPHKNNHIYHVLDAADFPMSLIPNLTAALELPRLRTQNRRSKSMQYIRGRTAEVSFIITRSDLLAPQKEQVDRLLPYLQQVLRDALGRSGRNVRLGNIRLVSAKRGWWTPVVKEEIWRRGGAGWLVGKVNVGKSALFSVIFPKGRNDPALEATTTSGAGGHIAGPGATQTTDALSGLGDLNLASSTQSAQIENDTPIRTREADEIQSINIAEEEEQPMFDESIDASLLPPLRDETAFPQMPVESSLPGTTASPIRIPYGRGKGELIDLPGVERSLLESHVVPEHRSSLVMKHRIVPKQISIDPGQSLLVGGLIRITPLKADLQVLSYSFTPLESHVTSTRKAIAVQTGRNEDGTPYDRFVQSIATDEAKLRMKSAGKFTLQWDVTKQRTGSLTDKAAGKQRPEDLPFIVYSADILIEGVGWVELTCQVRKPRRRHSFADSPIELAADAGAVQNEWDAPQVEVFSPEGKFISVRRPMNAWVLGGPKQVPKHARKARPRTSMSMKRRQEGGARGSKQLNTSP